MFFQDVSAFYFAWPWMLLGLLLIPIFWIAYRNCQKARLDRAIDFSYTALLNQLKQQPALWKRLLFPISASLLLLCLVLAAARPTVTAEVPVRTVNMMMVLDISLSMLAEDIEPDRITAAKNAGIRFARSLPRDARIGLVLFAGNTYVLSPPTSDHEEIVGYLRSLTREDLKQRTEIGSALQATMQVMQTARQEPDTNDDAATPENPATETPKPPDQVIILLSDGDSHEGYPWALAAEEARKAGIKIHTVAVGRDDVATIRYQNLELPVLFSEATLQRIAEIAEGQYFRVFKEEDFAKIYDDIRERSIQYESREIDVGFIFSIAGLLLLLLSLSLQATRIRS